MKDNEIEKELERILVLVDHLKTIDHPEGNPFFPGSLSEEEAKQALVQAIQKLLAEAERKGRIDELKLSMSENNFKGTDNNPTIEGFSGRDIARLQALTTPSEEKLSE